MDETYHRAPIIWFHLVEEPTTWVGYCSETEGLYDITGDFVRVVLAEAAISTGADGYLCSLAESCLHKICPLNRTTPESYCRFHGYKGRIPRKRIAALANHKMPPVLSTNHGPVYIDFTKPALSDKKGELNHG